MVQAKLIRGFIFDIQGFSVHDGPGCRSLIFFKGCSLRCQWCSNPEGFSPFPEPLYKKSKCTYDGLCIDSCKQGAITKKGDTLVFDRTLCQRCSSYDCIRACCSGALSQGGYAITLEELYAKITRDRQYWGDQGGITLTGGEPFLQPEFVGAFLKKCYDSYIHTAVETCGNVPWKNIEPSLPCLDWIFFDLKHMDPEKHLEATGASNHLILESARKIAGEFKGRVIFRMPVIPGFNDTEKNLDEMISFIQSCKRDEVNLLPLHHFGREKHALIAHPYYTTNFQSPSIQRLKFVKEHIEQAGIHCYISSDTPF